MNFPAFIEQAALLANPAYQNNNLFYETAAQNRGVNLRLFHDVESAEKWLTT
ncbi:MAG: hypothetical protein AB1750_00410 [Chloroflexota bacterium]